MTEVLRVVMGTAYPYDESRVRGGVEAVALYSARALAKRGDVDLHVVSCSPKVARSFTEKRGRVTLHWLPTARRLSALQAVSVNLWRVRQQYMRIQPDVIHSQGFSEYAVAAVHCAPLLLAIHGVETFVPSMRRTQHFEGVVGTYRWWVRSWLARRSLQRASGVISNSGNYAPMLIGPLLSGKRVYNVFNPIDDSFFDAQSSESDPGAYVVWVGYMSERKNVLGLLEAFENVSRHVPGTRLHLVGGISEPEYVVRVRADITRRGLEGSVRILGEISQPNLLDAYRGASLFAMSSLEETAPMALAQAMAVGLPVVSTRVGGVPWMVDDTVTGHLVDAGDSEGMARSMTSLLLDPIRRHQMGRAAKDAAMQRFAADAVARDTVYAYRDLLAKGRGEL